MKLDNSNKRYSGIIAGILVIIVLSIFVAVLIGWGSNSIYEQNRVQPSYVGSPFNSELDCISGRKKNEPVAQNWNWYCVDVEKGSLSIVPNSVSWSVATGYQLDICTYATEVNTWTMQVAATGGYDPCDLCDTYMRIYQPDKTCGGLLHGYYIIDNFEFTLNALATEAAGCGITIYDLVFTVPEVGGFGYDADGDYDPADLSTLEDTLDCMTFDSNRKPEPCTTPYTPDLNKWVTIELYSCWSGCGQQSQTFEKILVHKNSFVSWVPNSRL